MKIIHWAAAAATLLFVLMNVGAVVDSDQLGWVRIVGAVLAAAGLGAALGLVLNRAGGWAGVVAVGMLNCLAAVAGFAFDVEGLVPGLVVGGLGVLLGVLARPAAPRPVTAR